jgi:hypothetical protein
MTGSAKQPAIIKVKQVVVPREGRASSTPRPVRVIASEAKQSTSRHNEGMDCFASLAMTGGDICDKIQHSRDADRVRALLNFLSLKKAEGAGNAGCTLHPRSRVQKCAKKTHTSIQVQSEHSGVPCAMALRLMPRSPRRRIRLASVAAGLMAGRSGRTDFATDSLAPATGVGTTRFCRTRKRRSSARVARSRITALRTASRA